MYASISFNDKQEVREVTVAYVPYASRWGWSFLSDFLLTFYGSNTVLNTPLGLLHDKVAFEGYKWPWINFFFNASKDRAIGYK